MQRGFNGMYGVGRFGGFAPWMVLVAAIIKIVILVVIIFIAYTIIKKHNFSSFSAIKILNERYAKGEIGEEEYLKKKEFLRKK